MIIGNTIKNIRKRQNLSQEEMANLCGISQTYLSQIENEKRNPNLETLNTISSALQIPLPILFFLSMEESDVPNEKREAFKYLLPTVKSLVNEFFAL